MDGHIADLSRPFSAVAHSPVANGVNTVYEECRWIWKDLHFDTAPLQPSDYPQLKVSFGQESMTTRWGWAKKTTYPYDQRLSRWATGAVDADKLIGVGVEVSIGRYRRVFRPHAIRNLIGHHGNHPEQGDGDCHLRDWMC